MLNIYGSAKRSVFYIIHGCYHKLLQERSFCTIVLYHRKYYWLFICMLNRPLLKCIYCYLTSCILCGFDLKRLDRWIFLSSKKLCKPMSCYPGYQGFSLACDGELRFVGLRPTRVARVTWPKSETAHEKPLPPRVMSCFSVRDRVWHWEFVVHNNIDAVCHPRCLRSKYV